MVLFSDDELRLFGNGSHFHLYEKMGAQPLRGGGTHFAVWAPDAVQVSVIGDFNEWDCGQHPLSPVERSGVWAGSVCEAKHGDRYKYLIRSRYGGYEVKKADPCAFYAERPPKTASRVWHLDDYEWSDSRWMEDRTRQLEMPVSIYEVHLGSWRRNPRDSSRQLSYGELATELPEYANEMGFTHVELMPVMEHPDDDSWGYRVTGYFSATSRFGSPQDLMFLIDRLHQNGIGVILDWPLSHFAIDQHGLGFFDGTHLYDHQDDRLGYHPDWHTRNFNYGRNEVRSFLGSVAFFWLDKYHIDGLRMDAVASMIYRDYARRDGDWVRNEDGGNEDWDAIHFLKHLNAEIYQNFSGVETFAEESTAWPKVTHHASMGGLAFGFKWDMGWMHDSLEYMSQDPVYRKFHHHQLTFRGIYAFTENFVLPLSHDEVVHGKGSLFGKMPGDEWQKFANLRTLFAAMIAQPAKKLIFMGCEFGQVREWNHDGSLDWHLTESPLHGGLQNCLAHLNWLYRTEPALHQSDASPDGFEWLDCSDGDQSTISWIRKSQETGDVILAAFNFTPVVRENYYLGAPSGGYWKEIANTDACEFGGSGKGNLGGVNATQSKYHGRSHTIVITLPPLAAVFFKQDGMNS